MNASLATIAALYLSAALTSGLAEPDTAPPRYSVKNLGTSGIDMTFGRGINNAGNVVGIKFGPSSFGVLYSGGHASVLRPVAGQPASDVSAINDNDVIVGNSNTRILAGIK